jgi:hypothetical protein
LELESNSSSLIAYLTAPIQRPSTLSTELSSNIPDGEFNNDVLDTLVPNLVPNLNKLELLGCDV